LTLPGPDEMLAVAMELLLMLCLTISTHNNNEPRICARKIKQNKKGGKGEEEKRGWVNIAS